MDFRFIAAGILAAAIGFVGGSTVFANAARPGDPTIAALAAERQTIAAAAAEIPAAAKLPALPKPAAKPVIPPPRIRRLVIVRRVRTSTPKQGSAPKQEHEPEHDDDRHEVEHEDEHEGGGDD